MRIILLTQGFHAIVDDVDYATVSAHLWCARRNKHLVYAVRGIVVEGVKRLQGMHNFLMGASMVDHRSGDALDNRRNNLRVCTIAQNNCNVRKRAAFASSQYKGVDWRRSKGRWRAQIHHHGTTIHLGHFPDEIAAARAYDVAARELFGAFAHTNFSGVTPGVDCRRTDGDKTSRKRGTMVGGIAPSAGNSVRTETPNTVDPSAAEGLSDRSDNQASAGVSAPAVPAAEGTGAILVATQLDPGGVPGSDRNHGRRSDHGRERWSAQRSDTEQSRTVAGAVESTNRSQTARQVLGSASLSPDGSERAP